MFGWIHSFFNENSYFGYWTRGSENACCENGYGNYYGAGKVAGIVGGVLLLSRSPRWLRTGLTAARKRKEIKIGKNFRIAPLGNDSGHPTGWLPHYHKRFFDEKGNIVSGIGKHHPVDYKKGVYLFRWGPRVPAKYDTNKGILNIWEQNFQIGKKIQPKIPPSVKRERSPKAYRK